MTTRLAQCALCTRFHAKNLVENTCDAFPRGIPKGILENRFDHRFPIEGDHGLQFEAEDSRARHPLDVVSKGPRA